MISLLLALALQTAPAPAQAAAGWVYKVSTDPAKPKSASATATDSDGARLLIRCDTAAQPIVSVQFLPKPAMAAGDSRIVTLTFDSAQADMTEWQFPGRGAYNGEPVEVFMIVSQIVKAKSIDVALDDGAGNTIGGNFVGPAGDETLVRKVYAACGLPYAMPAATPSAPPAKQ